MEHALRVHVLGHAAWLSNSSRGLNMAVDPRRRQPHPNPDTPAYGTLRDGGVRVSDVAKAAIVMLLLVMAV
jgi:hypothetical protein